MNRICRRPCFFRALLACGLVMLMVLVAAIYGMMPAGIEGCVLDTVVKCLCNGTLYLNFRSGRVIAYDLEHSPADQWGTYEVLPDQSVKMVLSHSRDKAQGIVFHLNPRRFFIRITDIATGKSEWHLRQSPSEELRKALETQKVRSTKINADGTYQVQLLSPAFDVLDVSVNQAEVR